MWVCVHIVPESDGDDTDCDDGDGDDDHGDDGHGNRVGYSDHSTRSTKTKGIHGISKVLAKQKQRDKSTTTIAIRKRSAAIDSGRRIDPGASVPVPARPQEEGAHRNPHS